MAGFAVLDAKEAGPKHPSYVRAGRRLYVDAGVKLATE